MTFVADCRAIYHGDQDSIQVISIIATTSGVSLNEQIKTARVDLLYNNHIFDSVSLTSEHYIAPTDGTGLGDYRSFFFHLPVQRELQVSLVVELLDGQESTVLRDVGKERDPDDSPDFTNPMLLGREPLNWKLQESVDYRRPM